MDRKIEYPAIAISKYNSFFVVNKVQASGNVLGWEKGYFEELSYFDSSGRLWPVRKAVLSGKINIFDRILNRPVSVSLEFGNPTENALEIAKQLMCELIDNDVDNIYDQFVDRSEFKELILRAKTPGELIRHAETLGESE
ncbi:MAG: hypothetical protein P8Z37_08785 [Acidobacteriota bacterium]